MNTVNNMPSGAFGAANIAGINAAKSAGTEKSDEKQQDVLSLALKPKFAQSREELIQNRIDDLREQLSALSDADEIDDKTRSEMRKSINEQISELNVELMDLRKQRMEKEAEKIAEGSADKARSYDRYEPSEALKNMNSAVSSQTALEQAQIQKSASDRLDSRVKVVKNEIKADASRGVDASQKERELVDLKAKKRSVNGTGTDKLMNGGEKDKPSIMTFNTGLYWIEEMRQKALEQNSAMNDAIEGISGFLKPDASDEGATLHMKGDRVLVDGKEISAKEAESIDLSRFNSFKRYSVPGSDRLVSEYYNDRNADGTLADKKEMILAAQEAARKALAESERNM